MSRRARNSISELPWGLIAVLVAGATCAALLTFGYGVAPGWAFLIVAGVLLGAVLLLAAMVVAFLPRAEAIAVCREVLRVAARDLRKLRNL